MSKNNTSIYGKLVNKFAKKKIGNQEKGLFSEQFYTKVKLHENLRMLSDTLARDAAVFSLRYQDDETVVRHSHELISSCLTVMELSSKDPQYVSVLKAAASTFDALGDQQRVLFLSMQEEVVNPLRAWFFGESAYIREELVKLDRFMNKKKSRNITDPKTFTDFEAKQRMHSECVKQIGMMTPPLVNLDATAHHQHKLALQILNIQIRYHQACERELTALIKVMQSTPSSDKK